MDVLVFLFLHVTSVHLKYSKNKHNKRDQASPIQADMALNAFLTRLQTFFIRSEPCDLEKQGVRRIPTDPTAVARIKR